MRKNLLLLASIASLAGTWPVRAVDVAIFEDHTTTGGGAPYSGLVGSFASPDISFATSTGYAWHPFGLGDFGALIEGCLAVESDGTYSFTLNSDDGSLLYINGVLVVDNGGPHGPAIVSDTAFLTAGVHSFSVEFFEDFGGPSGVDLTLPAGVTYAACGVPDTGSSALLLSAALLGIGLLRRTIS